MTFDLTQAHITKTDDAYRRDFGPQAPYQSEPGARRRGIATGNELIQTQIVRPSRTVSRSGDRSKASRSFTTWTLAFATTQQLEPED